jgi:hypothetical protein
MSYIEDLQRQVNSFLRLEPNWNSYGAMRIGADACHRAVCLLNLVDLLFPQKHLDIFVCPLANGGIQIELAGQYGSLEIECLTNFERYAVLIKMSAITAEWETFDRAKVIMAILAVVTAYEKTLFEGIIYTNGENTASS